MYIFAWNAKGEAEYINKGMRIYYLSIKNKTGALLANFIPCYKELNDLDNVKGMYDTIGGKFYTNQNNNGDNVIVGPDVK